MRAVKVEKLVLNARCVGESGDRSARTAGRKRTRIRPCRRSLGSWREGSGYDLYRFREQRLPNIQMTIEKIEETVEVHQLQLSYQVVDVQLSRNDECLYFRGGEHH